MTSFFPALPVFLWMLFPFASKVFLQSLQGLVDFPEVFALFLQKKLPLVILTWNNGLHNHCQMRLLGGGSDNPPVAARSAGRSGTRWATREPWRHWTWSGSSVGLGAEGEVGEGVFRNSWRGSRRCYTFWARCQANRGCVCFFTFYFLATFWCFSHWKGGRGL